MTRPASNAPSDSGRRREEGSPRPDRDRRLAAAISAAVAGGVAFLVLLLLGLLLYARLWANSALALAIVTLLFGAAGLYAGWIAAMMVFSAIDGERRR